MFVLLAWWRCLINFRGQLEGLLNRYLHKSVKAFCVLGIDLVSRSDHLKSIELISRETTHKTVSVQKININVITKDLNTKERGKCQQRSQLSEWKMFWRLKFNENLREKTLKRLIKRLKAAVKGDMQIMCFSVGHRGTLYARRLFECRKLFNHAVNLFIIQKGKNTAAFCGRHSRVNFRCWMA